LAAKKEKLLESAQKFIAKGQLERAIRDYEQIVALDSVDIRHRQKLAELLVRVNRKEEAIAEYEEISRQYSSNHFYLKAIAVHKQIQKLDPDNINITLTLASLNEKQGLIGNALAEYNNAVNHYLKSGSLDEAIKVIEHMLAADSENLNTHLKCAETYYRAGLSDKAYEEFSRLAHLLLKSGDESAFNRVCDRVKSLYPDKMDIALDFQLEGSETFGGSNTTESLIASNESLEHAEESPLTVDAETSPFVNEENISAEPLEPPPDMTWEEEIDLALLEDEGDSTFQDDDGEKVLAFPDAIGSAEELQQQNMIDFSTGFGIPGETDISEISSQAQGETEETFANAEFLNADGTQTELEDMTDIEIEIEEPTFSYEGWLEDSAQIEQLDAGSHEAAPEKAAEARPPIPGRKRQPYDLDGQLNDFKKAVDKQLDKGDTEARYNLGIAYKEMGLFDAAIAEFQAASVDPQRQVDCLTLLGVCFRDMGDSHKAEEVFTETLMMQSLTGEERGSLNYELAFLYEKDGRGEDALRLYRQVRSDTPGFRDASMKVLLLEGEGDSQENLEMELLELEVEEEN
jgi:tetratricopeptide (TPR) repeat protein